MKTCTQCSQQFEITDADRVVLQKFDAPEPTMCPDCRMQRRMSFRNEMNFHKAKCALTGKSILTNIPPGRGYKVIASDVWYGDSWDPLEYGRNFNFDRPFFEQMGELIKDVPRINLMMNNCENCDYCSYAVNGKDCYLSARVGDSEQAYYSYLPASSFRVFDCYYVQKCENNYEAIDCKECFNVSFSQQLKTCKNVHFSFDCIGCEDCFGCVGLRQKKYHFFNQPMNKEDYEAAVAQLDLGSYAFVQKMKNRFYAQEVIKHAQRYAVIENSENVFGSYVYKSRNVYQGFDVNDSEDVRYTVGSQSSKDIYDVYTAYLAEEAYNTVGVAGSQRVKYCHVPYVGCYDLEYCYECANNVKHCFASVGLKRKSYCILNKQYTEGEYNDLKIKIIDYMKSTGEYGQFFPMTLSPMAYNESVAGEYFPRDQVWVEAQGLHWFEERRDPMIKTYDIPDSIADVQDDILDAVLICEKTGRPYKIIPQELKYCRENHIPIPRHCPYQRHVDRIALRAPRKLWDRECGKCSASIKTIYAPERLENVVCEPCYLKGVY
jgi:hypothetical protein